MDGHGAWDDVAVFVVAQRHGVERITAGIRLLTGATLTAHVYRIGRTAVDAGPPNRAALVGGHLSGQGVTDVCLTHEHEDHVGAAAAMATAGARVRAPASSLAGIERPYTIPLYRRRVWGQPRPARAEAYADKVATDDATFEVVPTPGHSPDHVILHEPARGWVFSGDAYLGRPSTLRSDERLDGILASWVRVLRLEPRLLFPGHGAVVTDVRRALETASEHYVGLRRKAWTLHDAGLTVKGVTKELLGREGFIHAYSRGEFSKENLVRELLLRPPE